MIIQPQNQSTTKNQGNPHAYDPEPRCCLSCWEWFIQLVVWAAISLFVYSLMMDKWLMVTGIILGCCMFIYIITMFCSPIFRDLIRMKRALRVNEIILPLFKAPPEITFESVSYHYVRSTSYFINPKGRSTQFVSSTRYENINRTYAIPIISYKDVSGLFNIKTSTSKSYIKLHLTKEINFSENISYSDYDYYKTLYWKTYRFSDSYMEFEEKRNIKDFQKEYLIKMNPDRGCCVNLFFYIFFIFIPFCQFYKTYINAKIIHLHFTIRKIVSTRYNILKPPHDPLVQDFQPCIALNGEKWNTYPSETGGVSNYTARTPSTNELNAAEQYYKFIPRYRLKNNIVEDCSVAKEINYSLPPRTYKHFPGDHELQPSQIRKIENEELPQQNIVRHYVPSPDYYQNQNQDDNQDDKHRQIQGQIQKPQQMKGEDYESSYLQIKGNSGGSQRNQYVREYDDASTVHISSVKKKDKKKTRRTSQASQRDDDC